jgi:ADP-heptose:LPS heptosyltransferase
LYAVFHSYFNILTLQGFSPGSLMRLMKIAFARVDRIGDLILTLPCQQAWLSVRPEDSIEWLISDGLQFIAQSSVPPLSAFSCPGSGNFLSKIKGVFGLSRELKARKFDHFVAFHVPWWVALAAWLAGIKLRTGVGSQWFSWVFFNRRLRQRRSQAEKNEALYNLELIAFALGTPSKTFPVLPGQLKADKTEMMKWAQTLKKANLDLNNLVIFHPGMGGSARNWPPKRYFEAARRLIDRGASLVLTGTPSDEAFILDTGLLEFKEIYRAETPTGESLLGLLSLGKAVVAPSTGVAHLAAALGVPVIGIYSPVRVQSPRRWSPLGDRVQVLVPNVPCPGVFSCLGPACSHYDCMDQITVDSLMTCVMDKL